jgi:hypothetical protein
MCLSICYIAGELIVKQTDTTSLDHVNGDACSTSKKQPWSGELGSWFSLSTQLKEAEQRGFVFGP